MEFNVSSADLLKGISDAYKAIPAKTTNPILENFLFVLDGNTLNITATDQEITLRTTVEVQSNAENGAMAVAARQILDLLKALPDQPLTIKLTSDNAFECVWSNGNSTLPYFPASDYPEISGAGNDALSATFPAGVLSEGIDSTVYATAEEEMRPVMNGIFFDMSPEGTTLVASDAQKLVCYSAANVKVNETSSFILHKKAANILRSLTEKYDGDVAVSYDSQMAEFNFGGTRMVSRLVVGRYPDYRKVIPLNNSNILTIDRFALMNAIRRVAVCANKASNHIRFDLAPGQLEITAQDLGFALSAYEKLECEYNGDNLSIGFKSPHMIGMLSNLKCNTIVMKFAGPRRSALILPSEDEEDSGKICGIMMPIVLS